MKNLDDALEKAIHSAVKEAGQPPQVAKRLLVWMGALSSGESDIEDQPEVAERLRLVLTAIKTGEEGTDED